MGLIALSNPLFITTHAPTLGSSTMNATGESRAAVGRVRIAAGSGSKTISAAGGGAIIWNARASITFADPGTTVRIGVQDPASTGLEDTGWDVYADLVGGTDTITAGFMTTPMESGSKTIAHGDTVAVVLEMTSRVNPDSVNVGTIQPEPLNKAGAFPYGTVDTGTLGKAATLAMVFLKFDDGTYGWIDLTYPFCSADGTTGGSFTSFNSGSTPDEYGALFSLPFRCKLAGFGIWLRNVAAAADFEFLLYETPSGTPTAVAGTPLFGDSDRVLADLSTAMFNGSLATPYVLEPNTEYAIAVRPTTGTSIDVGYYNLTSGYDFMKQALPFSAIKRVSRTDQTGAFSEVQAYHVPIISLYLSHLDNGLGVAEAGYGLGVI